MGLYDMLTDEAGNGFQTKRLDCSLNHWRVGDELEGWQDALVELYSVGEEDYPGFAIIKSGVLVEIVSYPHIHWHPFEYDPYRS